MPKDLMHGATCRPEEPRTSLLPRSGRKEWGRPVAGYEAMLPVRRWAGGYKNRESDRASGRDADGKAALARS